MSANYRKRQEHEVFNEVREDYRVYTALDMTIRAIMDHGPDLVTLDHLKAVIDSRITHLREDLIDVEECESEG